MGNYNPDSPYIIGNEWAPIRQADYTPDAITERGYTFGLDQSATVVSGAYYVRKPPQTPVFLASQFISVYAEDTEDLTGPIHQLVVPVSAIMITGASAASDGIAALNNPSTATGVQFIGGGTGDVGLSFNTTAYSQQLFGKRIVNVEFLYSAAGPTESLAATQTSVIRLATFNQILYASSLQGVAATTTPGSEVNAISLTDMNPFWNPAIFSTVAQWSVYPWRYDELALFDTTGGFTRLIIRMRALLASLSGVALTYAALRITYCEEKRLLYGGDYINSDSLTPANQNNYPAALGTKFAALRTPTFALGSTLASGRYAVTQTWRTIGNRLSVPPLHTAIRQLYELPPQEGLQLNYTYTVDDEFTSVRSDVLPQITLHTASAIVTGSHPYGTVIGAPVYGSITAIQEIEDDPAGAAKPYPQVRFYARRFGNTTAPLRLVDVAAGTSSVTITPAEHDALEDIVDGWKEVTLRFATPPTFATAAGDVDWRFDAVGEIAPNQWQVLGADGPSPASPHAIGPATYYSPVGDTVTLTWQSPAISGTASDPMSDLTLIFSTDPPTVTGFALSTCTQAVTGLGLDCGSPQRCIPTGIYGNQLSWNNGVVCDTYSRTVTGGWGNADTGQAWTVATGVANDFGITGGAGQITHTTANTTKTITIPSPGADVDMSAVLLPPAIALTDDFRIELLARRTDASNYYAARIRFEASSIVGADLFKVVAGVNTTLTTYTPPFTYTPGSRIHIRFRATGSTLQMKTWNGSDPEPGWDSTITDASLTATGTIGVQTFLTATNTNTLPVILALDDFTAVPAAFADGAYEIQRWDEADGFWSTILDTGNLCVTGMCDFEARVGVASIYRMRTRNILQFYGPWVSGSATLPSPGVTGAGAANSLLTFTSNRQPTSNLAYIMQFQGKPVETFAFPEADMVQLQQMFGKDFFTAFHPLERGGEQFARSILVSATAIPLESMANFNRLRDLGWADLPYVCVRDELGNRWYATVQVPDGTVTSNRRRYIAQIRVTQTTGTPEPVDPS